MAIASSTAPRLGARWPPVLETVSTITFRISVARSGRSDIEIFFKSTGELILSSMLKMFLTPYFFLLTMYPAIARSGSDLLSNSLNACNALSASVSTNFLDSLIPIIEG